MSKISQSILKKIMKYNILKESVFDPINKTRSRDIFDENDKMRKDVRDLIIKTFEEWKEKQDVDFQIKSMKMIGSMTGFQYNSSSDIDINVMTDLDPEIAKDLRKQLPNGNFLPGTTHPINYWLGDRTTIFKPENAENIYNILTDEWEKKTDKKDIKVPYPYVIEVSKFFMDGFDLAISEADRDIMEMNLYLEYDPEKQELTEKEKRKIISDKLNELKADLDRLRVGKHILKSFVTEGYEGLPFKITISYEHEDPRYSMNAMVYKMIDRLGYYNDKLPNAIKRVKETIDKAEKYLEKSAEKEESQLT